ncbi:hypothetical protein BDB01DRAFT_726451 [Pilobolus umbonatus]|nr:hypothetical protein BDB01DRAFT_726451 [Pilobolus umbonatus]
MFKASLLLVTLSAALQMIAASSVTLTQPKTNAVWTKGSTVQIRWKVNSNSTTPLRLQYASGPPQLLVVNGLIADNVAPSLGKYSWKIPNTVKAKK